MQPCCSTHGQSVRSSFMRRCATASSRVCANTSRSRARDLPRLTPRRFCSASSIRTTQRCLQEPLTVVPFRGGYAVAMPGASRRVLLLLPPADARATWLEYEARGETGDADAWDLHDVRSGIAHICARDVGVVSAADARLRSARRSQLFTKGCYLGQEIVARTQHRGRPKRHLHRLHWNGTPMPLAGECADRCRRPRAGTLVNAAVSTGVDAGDALAVLNDGVEGGRCTPARSKFALQ